MSGDIQKALDSIENRIKSAIQKRSSSIPNQSVRLVAVSKTKPKELILEAYEHGQRHFGENYVNELVEKSTDPDLSARCPEIKWHFIGHLQSNKVNKLLSSSNLYIIETVDSEKLANLLEKAWSKLLKPYPLKVMIQVNTSSEENKSGVLPEKAADLVKHVLMNSPHLEFFGLMTIGAIDNIEASGNPDFQCLSQCRENICQKLHLEIENVELSMGMSNDFEQAIEMGSTSVRVGSSIFGARNYSNLVEANM